MSFLDTIRDRLRSAGGDYYDDADYYDDGYDDGYADEHAAHRRDASGGRVLGTTPRPEAESVSVYTRSGRPVSNRPQTRPNPDLAPVDGVMPSYDGAQRQPRPQPAADLSPMSTGRIGSGQLPAYVLRPVAYDDVQTVVQRVRTNQPVVVVFRNTNIEVAKRILDFCFGFSCGVGGDVSEVGDRVFAVLPAGVKLTSTDLDKLVADGDLVR